MISFHKVLPAFLLAFSSIVQAQDVPRDASKFTDYVAKTLRKEVGDKSVVIKSPLTIGLGQLQANLDRIFEFCQNNTSGCPFEIERFVKGAAQVYKEQNAPIDKDTVRVVLRTSQYIQSAQASMNGSEETQLQLRPFVGGLVALPVIDTPRAIGMLLAKHNEELGLTQQQAFDLGLENLRKTQPPIMEIAKVAGSGMIGHLVGNSYYPSRLLLLDSWEPLVKAQGGVLIIAIPATDAVFYVGEDTPTAIDALRTYIKEVQTRVPNRLSNVLLRWKASGWELVP